MSAKQTRQPPMTQREMNDRAAVKWAGPFGYAVLEVLRRGEDYSEADFLGFMERAPYAGLAPAPLPPPGPVQVTMSEANPYGEPDFVGDADVSTVSTAASVLPDEPPPPAEFYKRVTTAGRPGQYPTPAGRRDQSGRYVRPVR